MRNLLILIAMALLTAGCTHDADQNNVAPDSAEASPSEAPSGSQSPAGELAGTGWRLVKIAGMDDSIDIPDDPSKYTLVFDLDGSAVMQADCNRGAGTWTSETPGQLTFGPVVSTRALCPEGSLSEKYLAQFEWVRSYVMENGHLFLATMADGAIIEFEPSASN